MFTYLFTQQIVTECMAAPMATTGKKQNPLPAVTWFIIGEKDNEINKQTKRTSIATWAAADLT